MCATAFLSAYLQYAPVVAPPMATPQPCCYAVHTVTSARRPRIPTTATRYWLIKSEPDEASTDTLRTEGILSWTGVRNYQARNFMRDRMRIGDGVPFYHSSCPQPGIAGLAEVCPTSYPDPTQFDAKNHYHDPASKPKAPRWMLVDVKFVHKCVLIDLPTLRIQEQLVDMIVLQRGNRLSITPITPTQWRYIMIKLTRDPE